MRAMTEQGGGMSKKKILVVDDESNVREIVKMRLTINGYSVITAADGLEGLNMARSEKPDLIVLDVMLPKMDGFKVCRMLKGDEQYQNIPIILFTAKVQESDRQTGEAQGADAYLTKPYKPEELIAKIKEFLKEQEAKEAGQS